MKEYYVFFSDSYLEYPDNESLSLVISIAGCPHKCPFCHSPETQNNIQTKYNLIDYDLITSDASRVMQNEYYKVIEEDISKLIKVIMVLLEYHNTNKLVITGGDPLFNKDLSLKLIDLLPSSVYPCIYTGYNINEVKTIFNNYNFTNLNSSLSNLFIKCGTFDVNNKQQSKKTDSFMILASKNQAFYNSKFEFLSKDGILKFK